MSVCVFVRIKCALSSQLKSQNALTGNILKWLLWDHAHSIRPIIRQFPLYYIFICVSVRAPVKQWIRNEHEVHVTFENGIDERKEKKIAILRRVARLMETCCVNYLESVNWAKFVALYFDRARMSISVRLF